MKVLQVIGALFIGAAFGALLLGGLPYLYFIILGDVQATNHPLDWDMQQGLLAIMWGERGMVLGSVLGGLLGLLTYPFRPTSRPWIVAMPRGAGVAGFVSAMLVLSFEVFGPDGKVTMQMRDWRQLYLPTLFLSLHAAALGGAIAAVWRVNRSHLRDS